jgi:mono/diheme cytochrome c family protein
MLRLRSLTGLPPLALFVALGCSGDGTGPNGNGNGDGGGSVPSAVQSIFTNHCIECHSGPNAPEGLVLTSGQARANLVNVPSIQSDLLRVEPGDTDNSYLVHKIEGTAGDVGGVDTRMPLGGPILSDEDIGTILEWIAAGAPEN